MERPNLFDFGSSELSQDAVLAWLLAWADGRYAELEPTLHAAGTGLLAALLAKWGRSLDAGPLSTSVELEVKKIDLLVRVGDDILVAIEDKTNSGPHNDLEGYRRIIEDIAAREGREAFPLYVKTGDFPRSEEEAVRARGWRVLGRGELLEVLERASAGRPRHSILSDYLEHLHRLEAEARSWRRRPLSERWPWNAWKGFYRALEEEDALKGERKLSWGYVPNPRGGFLALWWGYQRVDGGELYLQLQQERLALRFRVGDQERRKELVHAWSGRFLGSPPPGVVLERPRRLGSGRHVALAYWNEWRAAGENGCVDLHATAERLRELEGWLREHAAGS